MNDVIKNLLKTYTPTELAEKLDNLGDCVEMYGVINNSCKKLGIDEEDCYNCFLKHIEEHKIKENS